MSSARSPSPAPLDDEDLLPEILLRLPPQPSSLPRASLVSKRWRSVASDPAFSRRFRRHHRRNPPLLGFIRVEPRIHFEPRFEPSLDAPIRVPPERLSWRGIEDDDCCYYTLGCRHGLVLILNSTQKQVLVWDPVTGDQHRVAVPPGFKIVGIPVSGAVLGGAGDGDHFQVVLVGIDGEGQMTEAVAYVYSSETGAWGNPISTPLPSKDYIMVSMDKPGVMVGDFIYWLLNSDGILEFDLDRKRLSVIPVPVDLDLGRTVFFSVIRADGGGLGFLFLSGFNVQLWKRKTDSDGVTSWVLGRTIEIDRLLPPEDVEARRPLMILDYAEENNTALMWSGVVGITGSLFTIQLKSLKFEKLSRNNALGCFRSFESVYAAETGIGGGAGLLHNT